MEVVKRKYLGLMLRETQAIKRDIIVAIQRMAAVSAEWEVGLMGNLLDGKTSYQWAVPDALIVWADSSEDLRVAAGYKVPKVFVGNVSTEGSPHIWYENGEIGRRMAEVFLERGFRSFAAYGDQLDAQFPYARERVAGFRARLGKAGFPCPVFSVRRTHLPPGVTNMAESALGQWLADLPKPVGIMADCDPAGYGLLSACRFFGVKVPEEVSVISVGGDRMLCGFTYPEMSAMKFDGEKVAGKAMEILNRILKTGEVSREVIGEMEFYERHSTSIYVNGDEVVEKALRLIRDGASGVLGVGDVASGCGVSRRVLEMRFSKTTGRGVAAEIRRVRLEMAAGLLLGTGLPVGEIGERCGFPDASRFAGAFKKAKGCSPRAFREGRK